MGVSFFTAFLIMFISISLIILFRNYEKKFRKWIKKYFFLTNTKWRKWSLRFCYVGILLLAISLLDFRSRPEMVDGEVSEQKTILLIDSSASMLAEDLSPNRFQKSIFFARHFVKNAVSHQVSIMLFSDKYTRVSPFSSDLAFVDSKLSSLTELDLDHGSSNLLLSIQGAVEYLKRITKEKNPIGNILILSDAEDHEPFKKLSVPSNVNVALVGVATRSGAKIPIRDKRGSLRGYKNWQGKSVITKFNEKVPEDLKSKIDSFQFFNVGNNFMPTDEIITFFKNSQRGQTSKSKLFNRKVYSHYIAAAGVLMFIISLVFKQMRSFAFLFIFFYIPNSGFGNVMEAPVPKIDEKLAKQIEEVEKKAKTGNANTTEMFKLAELYLRAGLKEKSLTLYKEKIGNLENVEDNTIHNYAVSSIKNGDMNKGIDLLVYLQNKYKKESPKKYASITSEILKAIDDSSKKKNQGKGKKKKKKSGKGGSGKDKDDIEKMQNNNMKGKGKPKEDEKQKKIEKDGDQEQKRNNQLDVKGVLKQLSSEDKDMQKRYINTVFPKGKKSGQGKGQTKDW